MRQQKTVGYVVTSDGRGPMLLGESNVLWFGNTATLFGSWHLARGAIRRTYRFAEREALSWTRDLRIKRVTQ